MATEQYSKHSVLDNNQSLEDGTSEINSCNGFECNICLESVRDPVVTICGHLYCWPCIYTWIHRQQSDHQPQCPVCKAHISETTLIPLYGPAQSLTAPDPKPANPGPVIPHRPRGQSSGPHHCHDYQYTSEIGLAGNSTFYPMINMFGEMMYMRLFGDPQSFYTYPISYGMASVRSARARRQTLIADQSFSRLCFFLCCCVLLCLLLF